jgi:glucuronokinase
MPTGRSYVSTCPARAALAGNPSDGYGGAVVAIPVDDLRATASATEAGGFSVQAGDPDLHRLLTATADAFREAKAPLPDVTLSASTAIPRSVGLAGSSALVIASLRSLAAWIGHRWEPVELAELALSVERDRLGIAAGLQDRLVQSVGDLVAMTFEPVGFEVLERPDGLPLFVAWSPAAAETSDTVHRSLRRRFDGGDPLVRATMTQLADLAALAREAIEGDDRRRLGEAMNRSFELRASITEVGGPQRHLVETGRGLGAAVNSAGSGGSVVGLASGEEHLAELEGAYRTTGAGFLRVE